MRAKLTDVYIQNLKPQIPQLDVWDTLLPSFGVRVGLKRKTFVVMYGNPRRRQVLGHWPSKRLADARSDARAILAAPFVKEATKRLTAKDAMNEYVRAIQVRPKTKSEYYRLLTKYLPEKHLTAIQPRDILAVTDKLLHRPTECRHAHVAMQTFFNWCVPRYLERSPMEGLKPPTKPSKRERVLVYDELGQIWKATQELGNFGKIIRLCILTGQRRGELSAMEFQWLSSPTPNTSSIVFPAAVTKNGRAHTLPISSTILDFLKELPFRCRAWSKPKKKLDDLSGVTDWTIHDIRRSVATHLAELAVPVHVIERILNHSSGQISGVAAVYNRATYEKEMREALTLWETELVKRAVVS